MEGNRINFLTYRELEKENEELKQQIKRMVKHFELNPVKRESGIVIEEELKFYIVTEWRKDKEHEDANTIIHIIPKQNVNNLYYIIKDKVKDSINKESPNWNDDEYFIKYVETISKVIKHYGLKCNRNSFNGGLFRRDCYFPLYYYPAKILQKFNVIDYNSKGTIRLLNKGWKR